MLRIRVTKNNARILELHTTNPSEIGVFANSVAPILDRATSDGGSYDVKIIVKTLQGKTAQDEQEGKQDNV
jgi:hypothetical protein